MRNTKAPYWALLALMALCIAAGVVAFRSYRAAADHAAARERLEAENRVLAAKLGVPPKVEPAKPAAEPEHRPSGTQEPSKAELEARLDSVRLLGQMRDQLAAARTSLSELQDRVQELEAGAEKSSEENKRLAAAEAELRESLASANRVVEAMQAELKGKSDRLVVVETAARRTADEMKSANEKIGNFQSWARDLEDLNRRRDVYLTNLTRRYRDLTDQLRTVALRLDNPQDGPRPQSFDLSRLQNAIQLAEEDMRQLANLNSQAARITQKMRN